MNTESETIESKRSKKLVKLEETYINLLKNINNIELYEENRSYLRQIIEVIIWGDQHKVPFVSVRPFYFASLAYKILQPTQTLYLATD